MSAAPDLRELAVALRGEVVNGQVLAPGPGHSKADRSLAVRPSADAPEGFVVHSFAGDDPIACRDYVRDEAGLPEWSPPDRASPSGPTPVEKMAARGRVVATYDYLDSEGRPYLRVCRKEPKGFVQQRWNGSAWEYGKPRGAPVPYRLPEMLAAVHDTVLICEGEKDADALATRGFVATTASEGAGKWPADLNRWFEGKTVYVLPDNDKPGRDHADLVARGLRGVAREVRVVNLPGLPEKGDVSDYVAAHGTDDLIDICKAAPVWSPETAAPPRHFVRPFVWRDPASLPRRQWLYGRHLIRKFASATFAPGGVGKSALELAEAMAMASGKPLLDVNPRGRLRVAYWNGEDPYEETERRAAGIALMNDLTPDDLTGWLHLGTGREDEVVIAEQTSSGATIIAPNVEAVVQAIQDLKLDVVIIDPFVSSHRVTENDNNAIDLVAKQWARIADQTNTAIELVHHTRKTNGAEITVEDGRGASALLAAVRSARVLNPMSKEEREKAGVKPGEAYFRVENGKANLAPPAEGADWYRIASVDLGNACAFEPSDNVGVVCPWKWPDPFDGVKVTDLLAVQRRIDGGQWRENVQATAWVGKAVAEALGLDADAKADRQKIKGLLATWIKSGALVRSTALDESRQPRPVIEVGRWVEP